MIHRVVFGSIERFIGILLEHFAGAFPVWLSPKQAVIIPVHFEKQADYAYEVAEALKAKGVRVHVDSRNEKLGYKIREAQMNKIPYQLVVGDNEVENKTVNIRRYGVEGSESLPLDEFVDKIVEQIKDRK